MFRVLSAPIIRSTIKSVDTVIGKFHVSMWCGLNPLKGVQGRESIAHCHGQVWTLAMTLCNRLLTLDSLLHNVMTKLGHWP
jgi:hypothetical protein